MEKMSSQAQGRQYPGWLRKPREQEVTDSLCRRRVKIPIPGKNSLNVLAWVTCSPLDLGRAWQPVSSTKTGFREFLNGKLRSCSHKIEWGIRGLPKQQKPIACNSYTLSLFLSAKSRHPSRWPPGTWSYLPWIPRPVSSALASLMIIRNWFL